MSLCVSLGYALWPVSLLSNLTGLFSCFPLVLVGELQVLTADWAHIILSVCCDVWWQWKCWTWRHLLLSHHIQDYISEPQGWFYTREQEEMEDFWAAALWALKIWLYLIISLIMIPAMFGFSLGISETYMTILVKTLEVLLFFNVVLTCFRQILAASGLCEIWPWLSPIYPLLPPPQWATLKMQKANADKQTLKASVSNGKWKRSKLGWSCCHILCCESWEVRGILYTVLQQSIT